MNGVEKLQLMAIKYARSALPDLGLPHQPGPSHGNAVTVSFTTREENLYEMKKPLSDVFEDMLSRLVGCAKEKVPSGQGYFTDVVCTVHKKFADVTFSFTAIVPGLDKDENLTL